MDILERIRTRYRTRISDGGHAFKLNIGRTDGRPFQFEPGLALRRAHVEEIEDALELVFLLGGGNLSYPRNPFETRIERIPVSSEQTQRKSHPLSDDEKRYYVIEFSGNGRRVRQALLEPRLVADLRNC